MAASSPEVVTGEPIAFDAFVEEALDSYTAAVSHERIHDYTVAGRPLRVRYATPELCADLHPALAHLAESGRSEAPFTVYAWGGERPGAELPLPPWHEVSYFERGNVRGFHGDQFVLAYDRRPGVFSAVDRERRIGLYWTHDSRSLPYYERAEPFRRLLPGWRQPDGLFIVHAAAVGRPDGGVLLAGRAGSGKSTTSVLCIGSTLGFAGDDFVLVEAGTKPHVHSLYSSAKLNRDVLDWRPDLRTAIANAGRLDTEKALLYAGLGWPEATCAGFPLRAVLLPRPTTGTATSVCEVTSDAAYKALLPDTLFRALGPAPQVTRWMREVVRAVPCYEVALGTDVSGVVDTIATLLDHLSSPG